MSLVFSALGVTAESREAQFVDVAGVENDRWAGSYQLDVNYGDEPPSCQEAAAQISTIRDSRRDVEINGTVKALRPGLPDLDLGTYQLVFK